VRDGEIIDLGGVLTRQKWLSDWYFAGVRDERDGMPNRAAPTPTTKSAYSQGRQAAADARRKEAEHGKV
jgi:hypothetical protein